MKAIAIGIGVGCLLIAAIWYGCRPGRRGPFSREVMSGSDVCGVSRMYDDQYGIVCYVYKCGYAGGIACMDGGVKP